MLKTFNNKNVFDSLQKIIVLTFQTSAFGRNRLLLQIKIKFYLLFVTNFFFLLRYTFTAFYTLEMIVKMFARGIFIHPFSYFRDPWNWLDFIIVTLA